MVDVRRKRLCLRCTPLKGEFQVSSPKPLAASSLEGRTRHTVLHSSTKSYQDASRSSRSWPKHAPFQLLKSPKLHRAPLAWTTKAINLAICSWQPVTRDGLKLGLRVLLFVVTARTLECGHGMARLCFWHHAAPHLCMRGKLEHVWLPIHRADMNESNIN